LIFSHPSGLSKLGEDYPQITQITQIKNGSKSKGALVSPVVSLNSALF
jgi:hypothetical protein